MKAIQAVGLVVYTYARLEERLPAIWEWFHQVETWSGRTFSEYCFTPRDRQLLRVWKCTPKNRSKLLERLQVEQPWYVLDFGYPAGTLKSRVCKTQGLDVALKSQPQPPQGFERYRSPSYLSVIAYPQYLEQEAKIDGFLELATSAWEAIDGVYGFIDVETGVPPRSDLIHNFDHMLSNLTPPEYFQEFKAWQSLRPKLNRKVWKAFWGNLLGKEHLCRLGKIEELQRDDSLHRRLPEYEQLAYQNGQQTLTDSSCCYHWSSLHNNGVLFTISGSPLDWGSAKTQRNCQRLQGILAPIAL